jgi:hypothetical protein
MKRNNEIKTSNSSMDSAGEDLSFDDSDILNKNLQWPENEKYLDYDSLKIKGDQFTQLKNSIKTKTQIETKQNSNWNAIYYTFFNHKNSENISLSELELRLKYPAKRDEFEKKHRKKHKSVNTNRFSTHSDLKAFINKFSYKKEPEKAKIIQARKSKKISMSNNRSGSAKLMRKQTTIQGSIPPMRLGRSTQSHDKLRERLKSTLNEINKNFEREQQTTNGNVNENKFIEKKTSSLLEVYDIKDAQAVVKSMIKQNVNKKDKKGAIKKAVTRPKLDNDNINFILANKYSFNVELDRYSSILRKKANSNSIHSLLDVKHLVDFKDYENYFEMVGNKNGTMISKYKMDLSKFQGVSKVIDKFEHEIFEFLTTLKKVEL